MPVGRGVRVGVDVSVGVEVAVGTAAVWVAKTLAAIRVVVAFSSAWEGPQAEIRSPPIRHISNKFTFLNMGISFRVWCEAASPLPGLLQIGEFFLR